MTANKVIGACAADRGTRAPRVVWSGGQRERRSPRVPLRSSCLEGSDFIFEHLVLECAGLRRAWLEAQHGCHLVYLRQELSVPTPRGLHLRSVRLFAGLG
eukprot:1192400-Prorocentrum_minimum.AAC.2